MFTSSIIRQTTLTFTHFNLKEASFLQMVVLFYGRPRHVHTFTYDNRSVSQTALYDTRLRHVHTFTCENRSVSQMALHIKRLQHVQTFTCETFSLTNCVLHHTAVQCTHFRPHKASGSNRNGSFTIFSELLYKQCTC